jgi:excisionase family DNA binding protein
MFQMELMMAGSDEWMSVDEVAEYLGKSAQWVYKNRDKRNIPYTPVGGSLRFKKSLVDAWLEQISKSLVKTELNKQAVQRIIL